MTLVAAEIEDRGPMIVSDTELTPSDRAGSRSANYRLHGLKALILHRGLAIAYAGNSIDGSRAILKLGVSPGAPFSLGEVLRRLQVASRRVDVDFLIASRSPESTLTIVSHGNLYKQDRNAVIGSSSMVRNHYCAVRAEKTDVTPFGAMQLALEAVMGDDGIPGVGGYVIPLVSTPEGYMYAPPGLIATAGGVLPGGTPPGEYLLPLQGLAEGGFRYTVSASNTPGKSAVGIYFQPRDMGLLLYPAADQDEAIEVTDVTDQEFRDRVRATYGVSLVGPSLPEYQTFAEAAANA